MYHTSHITHHTSHVPPHITHHTSHITHHTSHITRATTHHTSHITHHTSHITHHTSHITRATTHHTPLGPTWIRFLIAARWPSNISVYFCCTYFWSDLKTFTTTTASKANSKHLISHSLWSFTCTHVTNTATDYFTYNTHTHTHTHTHTLTSTPPLPKLT